MGVTARGTKRSSDNVKASAKKAKASNGKSVKKAESDSEESESESESSSESSSEDELDSSSDDLDSSEGESSGDELDKDEIKIDNAGEEANDEDNDEDEENKDNKPANPNKQTSQEQHAEQKKLLQERKLQRKSGVEVQHIKSLWERLRVKNPPPPKEIRDKLCDEIWKHSKDVFRDLVLKHDASRVVQTLVKYSSKERRLAITEALKTHYYELATSSYGKYLLVKLLHYGSKESKDIILSELHGKLRKLMRHREGAYVVEDLYTLYSTAEQKKQMIREFWGSEYAVFKDSGKGKSIKEVCDESSDKRTIIARNLSGTIQASVEKGSTGFQILHAAMKEYVQIINEGETREFIELLHEQFAELIHTPEGCEVACTLIAKANAKERKLIVRSLKEHAINLIKNEYGNLVVITLFLTVDDTVLVSKSFGNEFDEKFTELVVDKYARRPFLYLLNGLDGRFFSPLVQKELKHYIELSQETSKKPLENRRKELLDKFAPVFYKNIIQHINSILAENVGSQFVSELFLNSDLEDSEKRTQALNSIIETFKNDDGALLEKPFSVRLLKSLIQGGKWDSKQKKLVKLEVSGIGSEFAENFYNEIIKDSEGLTQWVENNNTSFIVVSIYESLENKKSTFFKNLKSIKKQVRAAAKDDENKGAQLLVKLAEF
ncbi:hypothetical protein WICMUC_000851 [Wickerhamomyces mucosus]|uniref:PUM-HD domain-containing protein n=1 Tax=Wickerhamomyces mucosus TaxID=1378264 RepID=A0A9P8PYK1_9ASCO|nr:hypothetical protein WICMUC_000851 [Wickerhamomyces mucosus]